MIARDAVGVGLRLPHQPSLEAGVDGIDFLEVIAENYLGPSTIPHLRLTALAPRYPLVGHGVSLNLLGAEPLDPAHLTALAGLLQRYQMPYFTEHLCWSASGGHRHHDLLPAPYDPSLVPYAAARAAAVQAALGVPLGLENLSSYVAWRRDAMTEWDFLRAVIDAAGCWYMLDINNLYVSSINHGFDPYDYLNSVRWDRVLQVHLAGHLTRPDGLRHDTHDRPVSPEVWALYREAWRRGGPFPTLIEWDDDLPPVEALAAQARYAREVRA